MKAVDQTWATSMSSTPVTQVHSGVPLRLTRPSWTPTASRTREKTAEPRKAARSTAGENSQRLDGRRHVSAVTGATRPESFGPTNHTRHCDTSVHATYNDT